MSNFNEDDYRNNQLNKHLDGDENNSACCDSAFIEDTDICSECGEHSESITDAYEKAMCDRADAQRELERENDE